MNESFRKNLNAGITEKRILPPLTAGKLLNDTVISIGVASIGYAYLSKTSISAVDQRKCPEGKYLVINDGRNPVSVKYHVRRGENGMLMSDDIVILENSMTQKKYAFIKEEEAQSIDPSAGTPA